ncbi:GntR family transcriptional regulator, partial [Paenibacillus sp. HGF5]|uniref:GntR family transcriptional regulator n=1 Tax=Paenibacillus sp. HGF5 TaxID=908341 RepID=UPI00020728C9
MELGLPFETYVEQYRFKYLALYHAIRAAIHSGKLPEGTRLPATRELARLYGVSRGSAAQCYDMLMAEGYVVSRQGSG